MKPLRTLIFFISSFVLLPSFAFAQEDTETTDEVTETVNDSIVYKERYGLRLGGDVSKLARSFLDDDYSGFEINGDYRLTKRWFLAGEIGFEERTIENEFLNIVGGCCGTTPDHIRLIAEVAAKHRPRSIEKTIED